MVVGEAGVPPFDDVEAAVRVGCCETGFDLELPLGTGKDSYAYGS